MASFTGPGLEVYAEVAGVLGLVMVVVIALSVLYWMAVGPVRF